MSIPVGAVIYGDVGDSLFLVLQDGEDHRQAVIDALLTMKSEAPRRIVHGWTDPTKVGQGDPDISATVAWDRYDAYVPYSFRHGERKRIDGGIVYIRQRGGGR